VSSTTESCALPSTVTESVALGGSFSKSLLPEVQKVTNFGVGASPVIRSGRSLNMSV